MIIFISICNVSDGEKATVKLNILHLKLRSSMLEEDSGLARAALREVCSCIVETALAWELMLTVQLLLEEYCLGIGQSGLGGY